MKKLEDFTSAEVPEARQYRSKYKSLVVAKEVAEPRQYWSKHKSSVMAKEVPEARQYGSKHELSAMAKEVAEPQQHAPSPLEGEGWGEGFKKRAAFTLAEVPEAQQHGSKRAAFTLAEVLITLGIIGVVAVLTIPTLMKNIQDRVLTAQVRTAKYKLTLATDKMKSLGLIEAYPTTADFIGELSKHFKIAKVCDNSHLRECWTSDTITVPTTSGTFTEVSVSTLKNGTNIKALGLGTSATATMGMITGDGVSMILTYSPVCQALDFATTYSWSTEDGKPVTNATTNCISAIFDVNGATGPNRIGKDVRTLNSLFGSVQIGATSVDLDGCKALKSQGLVKDCYYSTDYYAGAVKKCNDLGLHLPDPQTLAVIAGAKYGRTDIGTYTLIMSDAWAKKQSCGDHTCTSCTDFYNNYNYSNRVTRSDKIVCTPNSIPNGTNSSIASLSGNFWSGSESSKSTAFRRGVGSVDSSWGEVGRHGSNVPLCVGD